MTYFTPFQRTSIGPIAAAVLTTACVGTETDNPASPGGIAELRSPVAYAPPDDVPSGDLDEVRRAGHELSLKVYRDSAQRAAESDNLLLSAHGLVQSLAMTRLGAAGQTATEFASLFDSTLDNAAFQRAASAHHAALVQALISDELVYRSLNNVWAAEDEDVQDSFLDDLSRYHDAGVFSVDFVDDAEGATHRINTWASKVTDGQIAELMAPGTLRSETRLVLSNADTLKGLWVDRFDPDRTETDEFLLMSGEAVDVQMMDTLSDQRVAFHYDWHGLEMPLDDSQASMFFVLPTGDLAEFEASLDDARVQQIVDQLDTEPYTAWVRLPRFDFATQLDLLPALEALGLTSAFTRGEADFTGIGAGDLYLDAAFQSGAIGVDENGVSVSTGSVVVPIPSPITPRLHFDRPFTFFIYDRGTESLLFVGRLTRPSGDSHSASELLEESTASETICRVRVGEMMNCQERDITEAECLTALADETEDELTDCAKCWELAEATQFCREPCVQLTGDLCEADTCAEFCPSYAY